MTPEESWSNYGFPFGDIEIALTSGIRCGIIMLIMSRPTVTDLHHSLIGCNDSAMRRTNDIYDSCFQWDYEIGKHGVILGMKAFLNAEGTTSQIVGWTPNPEHVGFIGHPNYFITPDVILKWWMRTIRESLVVLSGMILSAGINFDHDFGIEKFDLEHFYDPARITLATAPHDLDHLSRLLFELQKLFSNRTEKAKLDASQAERFQDEMQKLDWCVEMLKDFRDRSELHQFFGCLEGLGSRDSFFYHPFTAYQDDCFDDEGNTFGNLDSDHQRILKASSPGQQLDTMLR
jgi:hypothetical protein